MRPQHPPALEHGAPSKERSAGHSAARATQSSGGAAFVNIQAGQFGLPGWTANPANPIPSIWQGTWTPASYSPRSSVWHVNAAVAASPTGYAEQSFLLQYGIGPSGEPLYLSKYFPHTPTAPPPSPSSPHPPRSVTVSALFLQRRRRGP
jgi:hypothetical protein